MILKIAILDYGVGNLYSLISAIEKMNITPNIVANVPDSSQVDILILPGVGSFTPACDHLSSLKHDIFNLINKGVRIFGICLGLQLFFENSEEGPGDGLGIFKGKIVRLPSNMTVPHMGWNNLHKVNNSYLLDGIDDGSWLYFVHSYYPLPDNDDIIVAETTYGDTFPIIVSNDEVSGTQFHPEKSGKTGLQILNNFITSCRR